LFVIVVVDVTRLSVWVERRRYEARVEVGCVRRGSRRCVDGGDNGGAAWRRRRR
jgi:hypothetical protein